MSVKMKFGSKDIPFVYKGDKLVYPNPIKDGLLLWYDFRGIMNTDTNKEVAKDLSGNGNDGTLTNFNFTEGSGYKDNTLVFDGVDDKLNIPELELDETAMSVEIDGKTYVYDGDKVVSIDKDSSILATNKNLYGEHIVIEKDQTEGATVLVRDHPNTPFGFYTVGARGNISFVQLNNIFPQAGTYTVSWEISGNQNTPTQNAISTHEGVASEIFVNPSTSNELKKFSYTFEVTDISTQNWLRFDRLSWLWYYFKYIDVRMVSHPVEFSPNPSDLQKTTFAPSHLKSMQIYNKPLLKDELLHNAESKGLKKLNPGVIVQDGLVLHYDFSYESNISEYKDKAFDYSGNGNHGKLQNFGYLEDSGYKESGLKFDGVDDRIEIDSMIKGTQSVSISLAFKLISLENRLTSIFQMGTGIGRLWIRFVETQLSFNTYWGTSGTDYSSTYMWQNAPTDSIFYLTAIVDREENMQRLYINNEPLAEKDISGSKDIEWTNGIIRLGLNSSYISPDAYYYNVKIYNRLLTPEEIAHNYAIEREKFNIE